ncbi:MAG: transposase [Nitrospira sp.]|nr:transposase [Nitrospira sp.]
MCRFRIELRYLQPGKPDQNAFIERFHLTSMFRSREQVQQIDADRLQRDNEERPYDALADLPTSDGPGPVESQQFTFDRVSLTGELTV